MKWAWIAAVLVFAPHAASAQQQAAGLGPYRFGMSEQDVRATAPDAAWISEPTDDGAVLTGGPPVSVAGRMNAALLFTHGALRRIVLAGATSTECAAALSTVVESLEPAYGPFSSLAPHRMEQGRLIAVARTEAGSELRVRDYEGAIKHVSASYGRMFIVARAEADGDEQCRVTVTFGDPSDWPRSDSGEGPSWDELDAAESLVEPVWLARPSPSDFARHFPVNALRRGVDGLGVLDCIVEVDGELSCRVVSDSPAGEGFGGAALRIARSFRVERGADGTPAVGKRIRVPIRFNVR